MNYSLVKMFGIYSILYYLASIATIQVVRVTEGGAVAFLSHEDLIFPFLSIAIFFSIVGGRMIHHSFSRIMVFICAILMWGVLFFRSRKAKQVSYICWTLFSIAFTYFNLMVAYST